MDTIDVFKLKVVTSKADFHGIGNRLYLFYVLNY